MSKLNQLEPFKFVVGAVLVEKDAKGKIVGERESHPVTCYGVDELVKWARDFPKKLAEAQAEAQRALDEATPPPPNRAARRRKRPAA